MTYNLTFTMTDAAVAHRKSIGQYNSWALQVDGASNMVTWFKRDPVQSVVFDIPVEYGIYYTNATSLTDGTKITAGSKRAASLGKAYDWDGAQFNEVGQAPDSYSIQITNRVADDGTFGLTKKDPTSPPGSQDQPICADILTRDQPGQYTPKFTIYVQMGKKYETSSVIANIGVMNKFVLTSTKTSYIFDDSGPGWKAV